MARRRAKPPIKAIGDAAGQNPGKWNRIAVFMNKSKHLAFDISRGSPDRLKRCQPPSGFALGRLTPDSFPAAVHGLPQGRTESKALASWPQAVSPGRDWKSLRLISSDRGKCFPLTMSAYAKDVLHDYIAALTVPAGYLKWHRISFRRASSYILSLTAKATWYDFAPNA